MRSCTPTPFRPYMLEQQSLTPYVSEHVLPVLLKKKRFRKQLRDHTLAPSINFKNVLGLPYAALQNNVLKEYIRKGEDYLAFCISTGLPVTPINYLAFTGYFLRMFRKGHTTRSFAGVACKIKWYFINVLHEEPLDVRDPVGYQAYLRAVRAMKKFDDSIVSKKAPLYIAIIKRLDNVTNNSKFENMVIAILALQNRCMQRLGELLDGKARRHNIRHYDSSPGNQGPFFVFYYFANNRPKAHKIKNAPYAILSKKNAPFAYYKIKSYLNYIDRFSRPNTFLFPHVNKEDKFEFQRPLSKSCLIDRMKLLLARAGFNPANYGGQSARRGGFLDRSNVPLFLSCVQGHWSPESLTAQTEYGHQSLNQRLSYF